MNLPGGILEPLGPPQQSVWPMLNIRLADQYPADSLLIPMQRDPQSRFATIADIDGRNLRKP
jgi:hypothetical protein